MTQMTSDDRRHRRRPLDGAGAVAADGALLFRCRIVNISEAGASLETGAATAPNRFQLIDVDAGQVFSARAVWRKEGAAGVAFLHTRAVDGPDAPEWLAALWRQLKSERPRQDRSAAA